MILEANGPRLLRTIGLMAIGVAVVWAFQLLAFGDASAAISRVSWILGAASIAGAGCGLVFAASSLSNAAEARDAY